LGTFVFGLDEVFSALAFFLAEGKLNVTPPQSLPSFSTSFKSWSAFLMAASSCFRSLSLSFSFIFSCFF
jgi:hypothetical protein